jgi:hypothetical protein
MPSQGCDLSSGRCAESKDAPEDVPLRSCPAPVFRDTVALWETEQSLSISGASKHRLASNVRKVR